MYGWGLLSFVVPEEVAEAIPVVGLLVDVGHAAAEAGLEVVGVVAEEVHDEGPGEGGKDGPGVVADAGGGGLARDPRQALARLHRQPRRRQQRPREHVDHDLLVHRRDPPAPRPLPEY